jgi:putative molybdopterin biosynthesis protein
MPGDMLSTKEVAEYLGIHEKQVYALIKDNRIPCTRLTGKWLFPKKILDEWIAADAREHAGGLKLRSADRGGSMLAAGSNDPVLEIVLNSAHDDNGGRNIFCSSTGSTEGLRLLGEGKVDISWCHLFDPETGTYNIPFVTSFLGKRQIVLVHLFFRELGFVMTDKAPLVEDFQDLQKQGVHFMNRQKGAGTRVFLDYQLSRKGIDPQSISGYEKEACTHFEAALSLLAGEANVCLASVAVSHMPGLRFKPVVRESFDMAIPKHLFFEKNVQAIIDTLKSSVFKKSVVPLGNYDFSESGRIVLST